MPGVCIPYTATAVLLMVSIRPRTVPYFSRMASGVHGPASSVGQAKLGQSHSLTMALAQPVWKAKAAGSGHGFGMIVKGVEKV